MIKSFIKRRIDQSLIVIGKVKARKYDLSKTIVLVASPRGGSTWLAETLSTLPGYSVLWEPLTLEVVPEAREAGLRWRTYIPPGAEWNEGEEFIRKVLSGEFLRRQTIQNCGFKGLPSTKAWIVKFCRAHMFLKWMTEKFATKKPILMIRHPCAVVASQMRHGNWTNIRTPNVDQRFLEDYPQFRPILEGLKTWEEVLAGIWCLEYFTPLSLPKPHPWYLISYEKLVKGREKELDGIFAALGFKTPEKAKERLMIPSSMTRAGSPILSGGDQLSGWKKNLKKEQIIKILNVVNKFGLDFYTDELEPDCDRLNGDNPVRL